MNHTLLALSALVAFASPAPTVVPDSDPLPAAGVFQQTQIHSLKSRMAGTTTILDQTSTGTVSGTIDGGYTDVLRVAIKQNGTFTAKFTLTCTCTVDGRQGVLKLEVADSGRIVSPVSARFSGRAVITDATGGLAGMRGSLEIHGVVDLTTGLSTYAYSGFLRGAP